MKNTKSTMPTQIKFTEPKKVDYRKYIQPKKQILVKHGAANIAILINN